ncbi:MAG: trigger factor [Bacteroidales bacterium]|nr:trigger factor [Bacteroidales bacterium]
MNITRQRIGELTEKITLQISKDDYAGNVEKTLKEYKRKANIPGFRPGKVPMQLIEKMYGKAVLLDELDKLINKHLDEYIRAEQLALLGDPIMASDTPKIDVDKQENFEFAFEIGLQPDISIEWPKKEKLVQYEIEITDEMVDKEIKMFARRFGHSTDLEMVSENCRIYGNLTELDENGQVKDNGIKVPNFYMDLLETNDEQQKKLILGAKKGDTVKVNIKKWISNEEELAYRLQQEGKRASELSDDFQLEITAIRQFSDHEINQELFDKIFGEGVITSEEMFREKMRDEVAFVYSRDTQLVNIKELKKYLLTTQKVDLPSEFLKKWVKSTNKASNDDELDKQYPMLEEEFKWQLIKNKIAKDNQIEVKEEDVLAFASEIMRWQMRNYYGIIGMSPEKLQEYGKMLLQKEEDVRKMVGDVLEVRILETARSHAKVDLKKVKAEEFYEMLK